MTSLVLALVFAASEISETEIWNKGVDAYRAGEVTNALSAFNSLTLSKEYGARAAEVVAKLEYERGNLEKAADAAHIALLANPDDERVNHNFTRATDRLPEYRKAKRLEAIMKAAQGQDPGGILAQATREARQLMTESGVYRTNAAERAVALADALSKRAERLAERWLPVREMIAQSVTNEQQAQTILLQLDQAQQQTEKAAVQLADLDENAYSTMASVESDCTRFYKLTAMPPTAVGEGIVAQSNAWQDVEAFNDRPWQKEALEWTHAFRNKFPAWARAYEQQAQADTNKPPFTAEDQAKISALATEVEKLQIECCEKALPPNQEKALDLLRQIRDLLPKDKNGGGGAQNQPNPQQNQQNKQDQQDKQDQQQNQDQQQQDQDQQQDEQKAEEQKEEEKQAEAEESPQDKEDEQLEAILKKAQERNDEHEADKKARMRKAKLPPNERDW